MTQEVNHTAEAWLNVLRSKIDAQIRALMHPHHTAHEPGGKDMVYIPLAALEDVYASTPDHGDTIIYDETTETWKNGPSTGSGGVHEAYLAFTLPATIVPPGPKNISGGAEYILAVNAISDGAVSGTTNGMSISIGAGGGEQNATTRTTWASGARLAVTGLTYGDDASYLAITWSISNT